MNKEQVTGKVDELKGKVKEKVGHAADDPKLEAKGVKDEIKGKVEQAHGDAKEKAHEKAKAHDYKP